MKNLSDEALMQLVAEGNFDMMQHLFKRYNKRIYNFTLLLIKDQEISKDITQDTFYKVIKHRHTYKNTRFSAWIYTIARNLCNDYFNNQTKKEAYFTDLRTTYNGIEETSESMGNEDQLMQALNNLSLADKELIVMSKFQKMKYQEIAEVIGTSTGAVKTRTHRAMLKLRAQYFKINKVQ